MNDANRPYPVVAPYWVWETAVTVLKHIAKNDTADDALRERSLSAAHVIENRVTDAESVGDTLFDAYVAGFMQSGEGGNAEHPHAHDEDRIREHVRDSFDEWVEGEWDDE